MSIIISDDIYYFHKGFLNDEWKQVKFELYRNGHLARLNSDGNTDKTIDLKKCYNSIKIKPALEFVLCNNKHHTNEKKSPLNLNVDKDSKLLVIPNRTGNKWILLFLKSEILNEWMKNIKKWACVPKIKVEVYNESEEDKTNTVEFFQEMKSVEMNSTNPTINKDEKICKKFSFKKDVFGLISNHYTHHNQTTLNNNNSNNTNNQMNHSDFSSQNDKTNEKRKIRPIFSFGHDSSKFQILDVNS